MNIISVITVVKNDLHGLMRTHKSVRSQLFKSYEWFVWDGGSRDGTLEYLAHADGLRKRFHSEKDRGIYDAMNKSLDLVTGRYCVFMNAGDTFFDERTLFLVNEIIRREAPGLICGDAIIRYPNGLSFNRKARSFNAYVWHGLPSIHQSTYYLTEYVRDLKYSLDYKICSDYCMAVQLFNKSVHAITINRPLSVFYAEGISSRRPILLFSESFKIQVKLLKLPSLVLLFSSLKRIISLLLSQALVVVDRLL